MRSLARSSGETETRSATLPPGAAPAVVARLRPGVLGVRTTEAPWDRVAAVVSGNCRPGAQLWGTRCNDATVIPYQASHRMPQEASVRALHLGLYFVNPIDFPEDARPMANELVPQDQPPPNPTALASAQ